MNITRQRHLKMIVILAALLGAFGIDTAHTETKDNRMETTAIERPLIDQARPQQTETAIFALG